MTPITTYLAITVGGWLLLFLGAAVSVAREKDVLVVNEAVCQLRCGALKRRYLRAEDELSEEKRNVESLREEIKNMCAPNPFDCIPELRASMLTDEYLDFKKCTLRIDSLRLDWCLPREEHLRMPTPIEIEMWANEIEEQWADGVRNVALRALKEAFA